MPIKLFQDGQVLDAADVNTYFMDQALIIFDDETDRDAAFGGENEPLLKEGRICFLKSDRTLYIYVDEVPGTELPGWTPQLANIEPESINSSRITNETIVNGDISPTAAIALSKLATGALPTGITIASANIVNGTIVNEDIKSDAAIALTKLATGALPTDITIASDNIVNGTIVDADISDSAGITLTKLATGALPTTITVASANIVNGTIVNADINDTAAIALSKLATGALPTAITVTSANVVNGSLLTTDFDTTTAVSLGGVPVITVSNGNPSGGKNGDIHVKVIV